MQNSQVLFFPFTDYWHLYVGFTAAILVMLGLDLGVFHRKAKAVRFHESLIWTLVWIGLAILFNIGLYYFALADFLQRGNFLETYGLSAVDAAKKMTLEFSTGYVIEKALAVDNIFIFVMIFGALSIPPKNQHRILFYGILGALIFRAIFIALGSYLFQFHAIVLIFGGLLILTGLKMIFLPSAQKDPSANVILKTLRRYLPVSEDVEERRFFVRKNKKNYVTPLFVALLFIELSDIIFAVDSVPAIFAITSEPFIVFTSNVLAILGLRSMYFMLAGVADRFHLLQYGLAFVLIFVGLKMSWLNDLWDGKFPISWSLFIVAVLIVSSILLSLWVPEKRSKKVKV